MEVTFYGHACFLIDDGRSRVIIDPFLTGNPLAPVKAEAVQVNAVLVSHGHGDHLGDAVSIAKRCNAPIIAPYELAVSCQMKGAPVHPMHIGGSHTFPFGRVKLTLALHGSGELVGNKIEYAGNPCGFIVQMGGKTVYHAGDTGLFGDMQLIGRYFAVDLAMLPIGDNFVMGIDDAVEAAKFLRAKTVIPMHYNTFDVIKQDPEEFRRKVEGIARCVVLKPGEKLTL